MNRDEPALRLIAQIHRASVHEVSWQAVAEGLADLGGGGPVCISLVIPRHPTVQELYCAGLGGDFAESLARAWVELMPWRREHSRVFSGAFTPANRPLGDMRLEETEFYRDWMAPRNLPPVWPVTLTIGARRLQPEAWFLLMRPPGNAFSFEEDELVMLNRLVPHLERAVTNYIDLQGIEWSRDASEEVMNRMRLGVFLIDSERKVVRTNPSADRMLADGALALRSDALHVPDPVLDRQLQEAIGRALENAAQGHFHLEEHVFPSREDAGPDVELLVKGLLPGLPGDRAGDAVAAIMVARPDEISTFPGHIVRRLYALTAAEEDLLHLLVDGATLSQAAARRGVAIATARSQLKAIFAKTGTKRQGELVQRVLAGVMAVWQGQNEADREARRMSPPGRRDV